MTEHMLRNRYHIGLEEIKPEEGEGQKDDSTHHAKDDGATVSMWMIVVH